MTNNKLLYFFFSFSFLIGTAYGQDKIQRCHFNEYQESLFKKRPEMKRHVESFNDLITEKTLQKSKQKTGADLEILTIPVVVHVVHNVASSSIGNRNISDEQILSQIRVLNEDFRKIMGTPGFNTSPVGADTRIEFCLANRDLNGAPTNGIVRVYNSKTSFSINDDAYLKSLSLWPSHHYLNIWVTQLSQQMLGYAQFPSGSGVAGLGSVDEGAATDGVVIDYRFFGSEGTVRAPYDKGRTTTHEVGHWLGLRHIWGDSQCGTDYVHDTPRHESENHDCGSLSDCSGTGFSTQDMVENYMDYTPDACMNIYTNGQSERMRIVMQNSPRRAALKSSPGCCKRDVATLDHPYLADFEMSQFESEGWVSQDTEENENARWEKTFIGNVESFNSVRIENNSGTVNRVDHLVSPFFKFDTITNPVMDLYIAHAANNTGETDRLVISYSANCFDWVPLKEISGQELISTTRVTDEFIPQGHEWKRHRLNLHHLAGVKIVFFRFENHSKGVNNLYIDDIHIYRTTPELNVNFYPNPASEKIYAEVVFPDDKNVTFEIFNSQGQKITQWEETNMTTFIKEINISGLRSGMYLTKISIDGKSVVKKFIVL